MHRNWLIANSILFSFISSVVFVSFQFHDYIVQFIFQMALLFTDIHWSHLAGLREEKFIPLLYFECQPPFVEHLHLVRFHKMISNPLISTIYLFFFYIQLPKWIAQFDLMSTNSLSKYNVVSHSNDHHYARICSLNTFNRFIDAFISIDSILLSTSQFISQRKKWRVAATNSCISLFTANEFCHNFMFCTWFICS